jgi:mono/diheme cytochrome c family protein
MRTSWTALVRALVLLLSLPALASANPQQVERGRYLAYDVAMCVQCHTPRDADGALIAGQEFMGAPFPLTPPAFMSGGEWCIVTPRIAGLPGFTEDEAVRFFMNGARLGKHQPKWPMPPFHLSREDAEAIVAYLMSIR